MEKPMLAAFDFDHTLIDGDALQALVELGTPGVKLPDIKKEYTFDADVIKLTTGKIRNVQSKGVTAEDMRKAIQTLPGFKNIDSVFRYLNDNNCDIIIVTDLHSIAIRDWLDGTQFGPLVTDIIAVPSRYRADDGYLEIEPYHKNNTCKLGFRPICKGLALETYIEERATSGVTYNTVAFFGDGRNDLCPMLRLSEKDLAFPREDRPLLKLIREGSDENVKKIKATICPWRDGDDIMKILPKYIKPRL